MSKLINTILILFKGVIDNMNGRTINMCKIIDYKKGDALR